MLNWTIATEHAGSQLSSFALMELRATLCVLSVTQQGTNLCRGFGGNWDKFGGGGLLAAIASQCRTLPKFLVISTKQTKPWAGFTLISGVQPDKERC
jgi:hypothetical protein